MKKHLLLIVATFVLYSCNQSQSQNSTKIGGNCEGCEALYEYGNHVLNNVDTLPLYNTSNKKIKLTGTVYKKDGVTPAKDVILYIYQTNEEGRYPSKNSSRGWERNHGYIRGWIKTDADGKYTIYTFRPASYPNSTVPQHIHITVKEPDKSEYYVEDFYFADDPNLPSSFKTRAKPRGGSGVVTLKGNKIKKATRDIILGLHIPNYPVN
jgi:protocatechuate 3,4-dioxygenase beta subunit